MMRVEIPRQDEIYNYLKSRMYGDPSEGYKACIEPHFCSTDMIRMPPPLGKAILMVRGSGSYYSADFTLGAKRKENFKGLSGPFGDYFSGERLEWRPLNADLVGDIARRLNGRPVISITDCLTDDESDFPVRRICLGCSSAEPRNMEPQESFGEYMTLLERVTNTLLKVFYTYNRPPAGTRMPSVKFFDPLI